MAMPVDDPAATAVIEWIRPEAGGNRTGPPDWPVAVEIVFPWEVMRHYHPEHIDMNWGTTVIIDPIDLITAYVWESKLDFIARRAVLPLLEADRQVAIHRGGRQIVAVSRIKKILGPAGASQSSPLPRPGRPPVSPPDQTREVIAAATINWLSPETGGLDHPPTTGSFTVIASFFGGSLWPAPRDVVETDLRHRVILEMIEPASASEPVSRARLHFLSGAHRLTRLRPGDQFHLERDGRMIAVARFDDAPAQLIRKQ